MTIAADDADAASNAWSPSYPRTVMLKSMVLVALATIPFLPTLRGPFFWDDAINIEFNRALRTPEGLTSIWIDPLASFQYYPLTYSLFWIEFQLFGARPFGFHVVSLALHSFNALLVWRTLVGLRAPAPWWVAALFAVHPVQVETVGWISEQKNLLSTFFALASLRCWVEYSTRVARRWLAAATLAFIAALASKTAVVVLPIWIILFEVVGRRSPVRQWLPPMFIWIAIGVAAGLVTTWRETAGSNRSGSAAEMPPVLRLDERVVLSAQSLGRYAALLCCLEPFVPIPVRSIPSWNHSSAIAAMIGVLVFTAIAVFEWRRGRPWVLLGSSFFAFMLGPTLGLVSFQFQCHSFIAEHFAYLACVGFFMAICSIWFREDSLFLLVVGTAVLITLVLFTWKQSFTFADPIHLWRATIDANPKAWAAHVNLADLLLKKNLVAEAAESAQRAVEIEPHAAMAHENLGIASARLGRLRDAERAFREALRIRPADPRFHHNLANVLVRQGRLREAIEEYQRAVEGAPENSLTHHLIGETYKKLGLFEESRAAFLRALEFDPSRDDSRSALESLDHIRDDQLK